MSRRNSNAISSTLAIRPQLATRVRELTLNSVEGHHRPPKHLQLSGLQRLRLVDVDLSDPWVCVAVATSAPSLRELSLRDCSADDAAAFHSLIGRLTQLRHLNVERCRSGSYDQSIVPNVSIPTLLSLSLINNEPRDVSTATVVQALIEHPMAFQTVRFLDIGIASGNLSSFNEFLRAVGPSLRELRVRVFPEAVSTHLPLTPANCSELRLLEFKMELRREAQGVDPLSWVPALLDTMRAPKLRLVKFVIKAQSATCKDLVAFDWDKVACTLQEERFASVCEVMFHIHHAKDTVASFIRTRLGAPPNNRGLRIVQRATSSK
ncbi:hypothetical protein BD309DRAFT_987877 [Dichomitus squalens]|nr:hypothetical protein BD309DRAFT_987877 [Dichomitus squalens]